MQTNAVITLVRKRLLCYRNIPGAQPRRSRSSARLSATTGKERAVILEVDVRARDFRYSGCNGFFSGYPFDHGVPLQPATDVTAAGEQAISRRFATSRSGTLAPMSHSRASLLSRAAAAACILVALVPAAARARPVPAPLAFQVREGRILNEFLRQGPVAAHLVLRSGPVPRILIAFPAGNSGAGLWFARQSGTAPWKMRGEPQAIHARDEQGRPLYGISAQVTLADRELRIQQAVLSSVRVLRDYQSLGTLPAGIGVSPSATDKALTWSRDRLDGAAGYRLTL